MNLQDAANQVLDHAADKRGEEKAALISYANLLLRNEVVPRKISKAAKMTGINYCQYTNTWRVRLSAYGVRLECGREPNLRGAFGLNYTAKHICKYG